jgi:hypothetical protein
MIVKSHSETRPSTDSRIRAGQGAEHQMAFYLHRAFASTPNLFILNDLRLEDPNQPDPSGPGVCQIDHLAVHQRGLFIIESKSVTDQVSVRADGSGGDEWSRRYRGREQGFQSPIQQAQRQAEFLRAFLQANRESLLGKMPTGLRMVSKLIHGTDQRGFLAMPAQIIVAVSDSGNIRRVNRWKEPTEPFRTFVTKADLVPEKIKSELARHASSASLLGEAEGDYGQWSMKVEEAETVARFLASRHSPKSTPARDDRPVPASVPTSSGTRPACKACNGARLSARHGRYGYYWTCIDCSSNTSMPTLCSVCGAGGERDGTVRISKSGPAYFRCCKACGIDERIWTEPG